jgi:hypothetical protein
LRFAAEQMRAACDGLTDVKLLKSFDHHAFALLNALHVDAQGTEFETKLRASFG